MDQLTHILLPLCNALLYPVIGLLLLMLLGSVVYLGGFVGEWISRLRYQQAFSAKLRDIKQDSAKREALIASTTGLVLIDRAFGLYRDPSGGLGDADKVLDDLQLAAERKLSLLLIGVRLGPMLGLAGTLIPLGPALQALSEGAFDLLAQRLIVAFSTTVLGLIVGGMCYVMHSFRQGWYTQDLSDLGYVLANDNNG